MRGNVKVIIAVMVVLVLAVWGYSLYDAHSKRAAMLAMVKNSAERLRTAVSAKVDDAIDFDAHARAVDGHVTALRGMNAGASVELRDAADGYLVTVREILRRQHAMRSAREGLAKSTEALGVHIQTDRGAADWTRQAVTLKSSVDRDLRDYRIATDSYASLLDTLPGAQAKLAPHVNAAWLVDEKTIRDAKAAALDALARTEENTQQATQLDAGHGKSGGARGR